MFTCRGKPVSQILPIAFIHRCGISVALSCYAAVAAAGSDGESTQRAALRHPGWTVNSRRAIREGHRGSQDAAERP